MLIGFSQGFLGDNIVSDSRAEELTRLNHLEKEQLTQKEKETIEKILITEEIEGQSILNYCIHKSLEVYESKKDKEINHVKVYFLENKISIEYGFHELSNRIPVSDRIFNNKESKQFLGWKEKYNKKT